MKKSKWTIALIILLVGSLGAVGVALAQRDSSTIAAQRITGAKSSLPPGLQQRPLSPDFLRYLRDKAAGKVVNRTPDGRGLGYVPPPIKLSRGISGAVPQAEALAYPVVYDLRALGKVSPVYDQGACGSCWTFASLESLESYLRPGYTTRTSENNMNVLHDFDWSCCYGGNALIATAYLSRWGCTMLDYSGNPIYAGPVTNACDPYSGPSCTGVTTCPLVKHVQNVYFLPIKTSRTDNGKIKSALMTYGAVYSAFQWQGYSNVLTPYWNPATYSYYDKTRAGGNHAVTIIGWDDSFPKTNFSTVPPGNGAWICRNSWGTSWGDYGDFYVSYYDINMGWTENAVYTGAAVSNYTTHYFYDPFGMENSYGWVTDDTAYGANVFTASAAGTLKAIGFWTTIDGTQFTAKVYVNPSTDNPASGTLKSTLSGSVSRAGYYTKALSTTVPLTNGQKFSVVIKFTTPGDGYPVPCTDYVSGFNYQIPNNLPDVTYISHDGITWYDMYDYYWSLAVNIHAFVK